MSRTRRHRTVASVCALVLLSGACSSDDDMPGGLRDIRDSDPDVPGTEPDAPNEDADEPDEPEPEADPEPDPTERDEDPDDSAPAGSREGTEVIDGVFLAEGAFQINDDLDLDADAQRDLLDFALDAYLYTTQALNTGEWDEDELARYYANESFASAVAGFERYERDGLRQVNAGTVVEFMRIEHFGGSGIVVHRCITNGDDDGVIDSQTGEYTFEPEAPSWVSAIQLELVPVEDDTIDYRSVGGGAVSDVTCP